MKKNKSGPQVGQVDILASPPEDPIPLQRSHLDDTKDNI